MKQSYNIGIFGGTFDPIHLGHTESVQAVAQELNLAEILFIPAHIPPHKNSLHSKPTVSAKKRSMMVELVCKENIKFKCDTRELKRQQNSYTVDTLLELNRELPIQRLFFIIGMDSLLAFTTWHRYQDILKLCHLVVNTRPNFDLDNMNEETKALLIKHQVNDISELGKEKFGAIIFSKPLEMDISSTQIRYNLRNNKSCQSQLFPSVIDFINKNQLYR